MVLSKDEDKSKLKEAGVDYVYIELLAKKCITSELTSFEAEKQMIGGLFQGIYVDVKDDVADMFFIVKTGDGKHELLNADAFNIVCIKTLLKYTETMIFYKHNDEDQSAAGTRIVELHDMLIKTDRVLQDGVVVDLTTYKNLPKEVEQTKKKMGFDIGDKSTKAASVVGSGHTTSKTVQNYGGHNNYSRSNYGAKATPTAFKRTTKMPGAAILAAMSTKVDKVMDGSYKTVIIKTGAEKLLAKTGEKTVNAWENDNNSLGAEGAAAHID